MWRFLLAGLGTVGGVLLLFVGSFGDPTTIFRDPRPAPLFEQIPANPGVTESATRAAANPADLAGLPDSDGFQPKRDALRQLQDLKASLAQARQDAATLREQADQARREIEDLRQQRATDEAALEQARFEAQREAEARRQRAAEADKQIAAVSATPQPTQRVGAPPDVKPAPDVPPPDVKPSADVKSLPDVKPPADVKPLTDAKPPVDVKSPADVKPLTDAKPPVDVKSPADVKPLTDAKPPVDVKAPADVKSPVDVKSPADVKVVAPPRPAVAATSAPKAVPPAVKPPPAEPDARETVLTRLRREIPSRGGAVQIASQVASDALRQVAPDPPRVASPRQRLMDARTALAAGRTEEAQRLLEQAQVQLVFRPVGPSQDAPVSGSVAAGQVAEALSMLGAGDLLHAIRYINLAVAQADQSSALATVAPAPALGVPRPQRPGDDYSPGR